MSKKYSAQKVSFRNETLEMLAASEFMYMVKHIGIFSDTIFNKLNCENYMKSIAHYRYPE